MDVRLWSLLLALATQCGLIVEGFKNGKVTVACDSMVPLHDKSSPSIQPSSPYMVTADKTKFSPGETIKVSIVPSGSGAKYFEGFLIEARDASRLDGPVVGSFDLVNTTFSQLLNCGNIPGSAVSHTSKTKGTEMHVIWNAPPDSPPRVQFLATVVQRYRTFWVKIPGPVVSQHGVTPLPTVSTTTPSVLPNPFSSEGCGSTKTCLRDPTGCHPETDSECFFLSFARDSEGVVFELSGPAEGYVAFALSLDKWMGNDDVYQCVRIRDRVQIEAAYVKGRTHPEHVSGSQLSNVAWRLADGVIQCRFSRPVHIAQDIHRFDLEKSYYLFLADGRAEYGMVHRHDRQPLISTDKKVITGSPENMSGSRSPLLMKFHGAFMLVAWMTAATTGIFIARYFKLCWPDRTIFGQKVWFQVHRAFMILVVLLTATGFVLPFIYRGGWSWRAGAHPYLGCTVMTFAVLQPLMAIFRPPPDSTRRYIFNWTHMGAGTSAVVIAVAAMYLGLGQQALLLPKVFSTAVLIGFAVWVSVAFLVLELQKQGLFERVTKSRADEEGIISENSQDYQGSMFKNVALAVFITGNVGFLIALLSAINSV